MTDEKRLRAELDEANQRADRHARMHNTYGRSYVDYYERYEQARAERETLADVLRRIQANATPVRGGYVEMHAGLLDEARAALSSRDVPAGYQAEHICSLDCPHDAALSSFPRQEPEETE